MALLKDMSDLLDHYSTECYFECAFLAILPEHQGQGIGHGLVEHSLQLAQRISRGDYLKLLPAEVRARNKLPYIAAMLCTSPNSQKIGRTFQMIEQADMLFEDIYYKGVSYADRIRDPLHGSIKLMVKVLPNTDAITL